MVEKSKLVRSFAVLESQRSVRSQSSIQFLIVTHQPAEKVARMIDWWAQWVSLSALLVAYGGVLKEYNVISNSRKLFIDDPRLRTRDHQRERQSYTAIFARAAEYLTGSDYSHIYFAEFDHVPLRPDFGEWLLRTLEGEAADILGHHLARLDGTSNPHFLDHALDGKLTAYMAEITLRQDPSVVLSMFGSGSFWTREAFEAVAQLPERTPTYLELWLPTVAHHLGFRVRPFPPEQDRLVLPLGDFSQQAELARAAGAWTVHPVKHLWD